MSSHYLYRLALLIVALVLGGLVLWSCSQGITAQVVSVTLTASRNNTPVQPTATKSNTPVTPTTTRTNTPGVPTPTKTNTPMTANLTNTHTPPNYFVSETGSDQNPGSITQPWKTIQKAANTMVGGETVLIRGGIYNEQVSMVYRDNTTGLYITFINSCILTRLLSPQVPRPEC